MKFAVSRQNLADAVKGVADVAGGNALAVLSNVKLETEGDGTLVLTGTNLDVTVKRRIPCQVKVNGSVTVPARFFSQVVNALPSADVAFEVDESSARSKAVLSGGDSVFKMSFIPASEFPKEANVAGEVIKINGSTLLDLLRKVSYAASQDYSRRSLKGVFFNFANGKLTLVGSDGRRLSLAEAEVEGNNSVEFILPNSAVRHITKVIGEDDVSISFDKNAVLFSMENATVQSKVVDEKYPNFKNVIPAALETKVGIDRQQLLDAVRLVSVSANSDTPRVDLEFTEGALTVRSANSDISDAKSSFPIKYSGEKVSIAVFHRYLIDVLTALDSDEVVIELNNGTSPMVVKCDIPFIGVIMPLRVC